MEVFRKGGKHAQRPSLFLVDHVYKRIGGYEGVGGRLEREGREGAQVGEGGEKRKKKGGEKGKKKGGKGKKQKEGEEEDNVRPNNKATHRTSSPMKLVSLYPASSSF